jgi:hypothetical protein
MEQPEGERKEKHTWQGRRTVAMQRGGSTTSAMAAGKTLASRPDAVRDTVDDLHACASALVSPGLITQACCVALPAGSIRKCPDSRYDLLLARQSCSFLLPVGCARSTALSCERKVCVDCWHLSGSSSRKRCTVPWPLAAHSSAGCTPAGLNASEWMGAG